MFLCLKLLTLSCFQAFAKAWSLNLCAMVSSTSSGHSLRLKDDKCQREPGLAMTSMTTQRKHDRFCVRIIFSLFVAALQSCLMPILWTCIAMSGVHNFKLHRSLLQSLAGCLQQNMFVPQRAQYCELDGLAQKQGSQMTRRGKCWQAHVLTSPVQELEMLRIDFLMSPLQLMGVLWVLVCRTGPPAATSLL